MAPLTVDRIPAGPWGQNCYVAAAGGDAVVIDPGGNGPRIAAHLSERRLRVHAILATHGHHDHVGAVGELVEAYGAPFALHPADLGLLRRANFFRRVLNDLDPVELPPPAIDLSATGSLAFGALAVTVLHTPGHSPGSVCFEIGGDLFAGDTVVDGSAGRVDLPGSDEAALQASLRVLGRTWPADSTVHPGHGDPLRLGDVTEAASRG